MAVEKLNWLVLKENKCPKCGGDAAKFKFQERPERRFFCINRACDFTISETLFKQIISERVDEDIKLRALTK